MVQREGRILRQGNTNREVQIFRYITEGSFDAYSWQLLETKQRFITDLLSGSLTDRNGSDINDTVLNYAEIKALAIGNPIVKKRVETANELSKYMTLQRKMTEMRLLMEKELLELPGKIINQEERIKNCKEDIEAYSNWKAEHPFPDNETDKKAEMEERKTLREFIHSSVMKYTFEIKEKTLMSYRGFDIILPANMTNEKPYIWLKCNGKYHLELGNTDIGNLIRIDNFLEKLPEYLNRLNEGLDVLNNKEKHIKNELEKDDSFSDLIDECKEKLVLLDKQLGVDKNE